ncbi:uncharacterized protein LOC108033511 [Drosophila biarmipes]|uniref:uncharacterized protein LOC108033511 n=1 Tax=Drosophila biarmipes TaxID=125945 RepID=UPI0007E76D8D|nr:uncharacterized protein LOC108033511 [Drosophila biarmipes]
MTSPHPILLACFVHLVLHTTLFIQLDPDTFNDTPILGSQIFYLSVMDLLCDCEVIPGHWNGVPPWGRFILETFVAFLIGEFSMMLVWLSMEKFLVELLKWTTLRHHSKLLVLEISTVALGTIFSLLVAAMTNRTARMQKIGSNVWGTIIQYRWDLWGKKEKTVECDSFIKRRVSTVLNKRFHNI